MQEKKLQKLENDQSYEDNFNEYPPIDIVAFNELRSCADLLRLYQTEQLTIQPDFQREVVWSNPDQTRFIDSLTKQLPIPSMCISLDYRTEKRLVIDGMQRMTSIISFLSNDKWKLSELDDIDERISGKTVLEIRNSSREIYDRVQNVMIPITLIRCDNSKKIHNEYLFTIFKRLNSGGVKLNNQEIRNCIYNGEFNTLLKTLAQKSESKKIFGNKTRFSNEEMILRFFAFQDRLASYNGKLSKFLNDYMNDFKNIEPHLLIEKQQHYNDVTRFLLTKVLMAQQPHSFGKTFMEGLLYGISKNYHKIKDETPIVLTKMLVKFLNLQEYSPENLQEGLSKKDKVIERLNAADRSFKI